MNIQQYYQQTAYINLNGSIISAGLLSAILTVCMLLSWEMHLPIIVLPFISVCFLHYHRYLSFLKKAEDSRIYQRLYSDKDLLKQNDLMIAFAPAPALKLLFFTPDGMLAGELKEVKQKHWRWIMPYFIDKKIKKTFGLYDSSGTLLASFTAEGIRTEIFEGKDNLIGFFYPKNKNRETGTAILQGGRKLKFVRISGVSQELQLINGGGVSIWRVQKGWMPLEWANIFVETNTPAMKFDYSIASEDRLAVYAALIHHYQYYDH